MITSAAAGEGKTAFCVSLARSLALIGQRALVIDADFHRSRVAVAFGGRDVPHIRDVVQGRVSLADAVQVDARSGAHFLPAVPERSDPQLLLQSDGFAAMMRGVRETYDIVIIDTPPVMAATDATVIGTFADTTLFLVQWGNTPRSIVGAALRFLHLCGTVVDGIILSQVDLRRQEHYDEVYDRTPTTVQASSEDRSGPTRDPHADDVRASLNPGAS